MDYFSSWSLGAIDGVGNIWGPRVFPPQKKIAWGSCITTVFFVPFFEENFPRCLNPPGTFWVLGSSRSDSAGFVAWPTPSELSKNEVVLGDGHGHRHGSSLENSLSSLHLGQQLAGGWWCFFPLFWGLESPVFTGHHPS